MNRLYISKGERVYFQNKECVIVRIIDIQTVSIEEVENAIVHTVKVSELSPKKVGEPEHNIHVLSEKEWNKANSRYQIIKQVLNNRGDLDIIKEVSIKNNVSIPTIYRWLKMYDETGLVSSLAGRKRSGGLGKSRLSKTLDQIINDKIHSVYLTSSRKSISKTINEIKLACHELGVKPPHSNTIRNRIKNISDEAKIRKRLGLQEARYRYEPLKGNFPGANYPLSVVQIDHTLVDIILVDEEYRKAYKRPWITVAIDVFSRMVLGFYLSFESPGALGTGMCIANSILPKEMFLERLEVKADWPCWGIMDLIHLDNAKEFRGNMVKQACKNYGIDIQFRPIGSPHFGGHIERLMGTFANEIHNLPGTTFSTEAERKKYQSEKNASFTLKEFEKWLTIFITKIYHCREHSALKTSPIEKFKEGIIGNAQNPGKGIPPRMFNEARVRLDFMPYVERSIQEYGVVIDHIHYYDDVLRPYIHSLNGKEKRKFIFKRDPRDISVIFFYDPSQDLYFEIPYRNTSLPPISIWEYRDTVKQLKENRVTLSEDVIFDSYRELNEVESRAIRNTQKNRRFKKQEINISPIEEFNDNTFNNNNLVMEIKPFDDIDYETFK